MFFWVKLTIKSCFLKWFKFHVLKTVEKRLKYHGLDPLPPAFLPEIIVEDANFIVKHLSRAIEIRELAAMSVGRMLQVWY